MNTCKITTNSWCTAIDKLMLWRGTWTKYEPKISNLFLRVVYDQLLITANSNVLESFNMHRKIKGIYKDDIIILIVNGNNNEIRKIKFQIKSNFQECIEVIGKHFPVVNHNAIQTNQVINSKYRSFNEVLKYALERRENTGTLNLPADFENFVKLCILDPSFPQMLSETEKILNKHNF